MWSFIVGGIIWNGMDSRANSCSINWLEFAHLLNVRHPSAPHNRHSSGQLTAEGSKPRAGGEGGGILVRHYRATHCSSESDFARILRGMGGGSPVRYIDIEYRLSIYRHFWKISISISISISIWSFLKISISISIRQFWKISISKSISIRQFWKYRYRYRYR